MSIWNLEAIKADLEASDWERVEPDREERRCFLGTVFNLTPSGKFYTPWACSNVEPCPRCKGSGRVGEHRSRRVRKRNEARIAYVARPRQQLKFEARRARLCKGQDIPRGAPWLTFNFRLWNRHARGVTCDFCGGLGSREAYLDELWREQAEAELHKAGYTLAEGEGDPCDLFAVECRDVEDEDEEASD